MIEYVLMLIMFIGLVFSFCFLQKQKMDFKKIFEQLQSIGKRLDVLEQSQEKRNFNKDIYDAEIRSRLYYRQNYESIPEKYRYVISMAHSDISPDKIAEIFGLSEREVSQLVALAHLSAQREK